MSYKPQVNDYVKWKHDLEGWVYFQDDDYITIEVSTRHKGSEGHPEHKKYHLLVLCYRNQWKELEYVTSRESKYEEKKNCLETMGKVPWREGIEK